MSEDKTNPDVDTSPCAAFTLAHRPMGTVNAASDHGIWSVSIKWQVVQFAAGISARQAVECLTNGSCGD